MMCSIEVCAACLITDVEMVKITSAERSLYLKISGLLVKESKIMPHHFCHNCYGFLEQSKEFRKKCQIAHQIINQIHLSNGQLSKVSMGLLDRKALGLESAITNKSPDSKADIDTSLTNDKTPDDPIFTTNAYEEAVVEIKREDEEKESVFVFGDTAANDDDSDDDADDSIEAAVFENPAPSPKAPPPGIKNKAVHEDRGNSSPINCDSDSEVEPEAILTVTDTEHQKQPPNFKDTNKDMQKIQRALTILFKVTNKIVENEKKIMHKLARLVARIDDTVSNLKFESAVSSEKDTCPTKQIKNEEDLDEFEESVKDQEWKTRLAKSYSIICSVGHGTGKNCAYRFLDVLFSREFLCKCSWTGGSRDAAKISLKYYKNTLGFFFDMVNYWDPTFSQEDNENFFKIVLKNAKKRRDSKCERMSSAKHRSKRQKTANKEDVTESFIEEQLASETDEESKRRRTSLEVESKNR